MHIRRFMSATRPVRLCAAIAVGALLAAGCTDSQDNKDQPVTPSTAVTVSTVAGSGTAGFADGAARTARFDEPWGIAVGASGMVYVADSGNHRIRTIDTSGNVRTLAGTGTAGFRDGAGAQAQFNEPRGLAVDQADNVYVADFANSRVRKITPAGVVSTILDTSGEPPVGTAFGMDRLNRPAGVAVDAAGNVYVSLAFTIRRITPQGVVQPFAGSVEGYADGPAASAQFASPGGIAVDRAGNLYVADPKNNRIRRIAPDGMVSTLAGSGERGFRDGPGSAAQFNTSSGLAVDAEGNVYVADANNDAIRRITPAGQATTLAGNGNPGLRDGPAAEARFDGPFGVAVDNSGSLYVADGNNHRIRRIAR